MAVNGLTSSHTKWFSRGTQSVIDEYLKVTRAMFITQDTEVLKAYHIKAIK